MGPVKTPRASDAGREASRALPRSWFWDLLLGKTERRLAIVILVTTMVPLGVALYVATQMFRRAAALWYSPEIGRQLDRGVDVYTAKSCRRWTPRRGSPSAAIRPWRC